MMRNSSVIAGLGAIVAVGFIQYGCSSTSDSGTGGSSGGQGGSSGGLGGASPGTGGASSGLGGANAGTGGSSTGTAGSTGTSGTGGATGGLAVCAPAPADKSVCTMGAATCTKNCGANTTALLARAQKPCACVLNPTTSAYAWDCSNSGPCTYPTSLTSMTACFHLPTPLTACPMDAGALIRPHASVCTNTPAGTCGTVCGSTTAPSYQDTSMAQKVGYCSCINGLWECASIAEWPTGV